MLRSPIRELMCFLDRLSGLWRYDFGEPFVELPGGGIVLGTNMYHGVDRLFDVIECARRRLPAEKLASYLQRLADPKKHEDMLFEFAPILRLHPTVEVDYEVAGYGEGNSTIDWLVRSATTRVALDVKNRSKDLLESLARLEAGEREPDDTAPAPAHDPRILFKSIESKFVSRRPDELIQAAWVVTRLKQEEEELSAAFAELDPSRVHVVILGDFAADVYALSNHAVAKECILALLQVHESRRFVFHRDGG